MERNRILLYLARMSGSEMRYIQEAFDTNWVVPLRPNVNGLEDDLRRFSASVSPSDKRRNFLEKEDYPQTIMAHEDNPDNLWKESLLELEGKRIVALCSGTSAVHLALVTLRVKVDGEVICQSFTFCASSYPVTYLGATPMFVDSEKETWNLDPALLEETIKDRITKTGKKPKAIIVVYPYGMPAKIKEILAVADKYDIPIVGDAAEDLGSRYERQVCGTFGEYGVLSFNGNKMITTSGGGALVCPNEEVHSNVMLYATQAREGYPYYQHEKVGSNYRMSNVCVGIGRGQMTVLDGHIAHHHHIAHLYGEALSKIDGIAFRTNPSPESDSNFQLSTMVLDPSVKVRGQENAYKTTIQGVVDGATGVVHSVGNVHADYEPDANVEAMRVFLDKVSIESRPLWKPIHKQPCYRDCPAYVNGVNESPFKVGMCLPNGPLVTDDDVKYIVEKIEETME